MSELNVNEPSPCPFCGKNASVVFQVKGVAVCFVACNSCKATTKRMKHEEKFLAKNPNPNNYFLIERAIHAWNKRVTT